MAQNVLGTDLQPCSYDPLTGFYRNGCCDTGGDDAGVHVVCARMTADFLAFSKGAGNDLSTPQPVFGFPGLQPDDQWCLCADRWVEALEAGVAPPVVLEATHLRVLEWVTLDDLRGARRAGLTPPQRPSNFGGRFSTRAANASRVSCSVNIRRCRSLSRAT